MTNPAGDADLPCFRAPRPCRPHSRFPLPHTDAEVLAWVRDTLLPTVTLESGVVLGLIAVTTRLDGHWIDQLYVHPARMRRVVGATLLQLALNRLQGTVRLHTFEPNRGARRF